MDGQYWKVDQTMYINNQWQPTQQVTDIFLAVPSSLTSEMIRIQNLYRFMYRQHVYDLEKRTGDCLMKWLIMLGFMDQRWPRICWRSTLVLSTLWWLCRSSLLCFYQWEFSMYWDHQLCFVKRNNKIVFSLKWESSYGGCSVVTVSSCVCH